MGRSLIGTTLDKYEVLQKVGEGGMATVYRGRHTTLHRDVAIKVLHPHLSSSSRNRKRFAREARAIEHLRHDNILEIFDYSGMDADDCYIITEFVEGETLSALLRRRGRFPTEVAAIMGLHLSRALSYAHREGILHRDLKPDNVMVRWDGTIKLMDFGIARFLDESQVTMTGALVGSPAFMSPEQARELPLDPRSDLFSLGTMLFYLVTGHLPFSGSNPSLILKNVIEGNRPGVSELAPTMSATLADVIERLMATSPEDRYNTADEVADALESVLAESNVDPEDPRWALRCWLDEPDAYEERLEQHLREVLLLRGKQHLDSGDHLAALRLFNRLLSMDEDNQEVLQLVQNLHGQAKRTPTASILVVVGIAAVVVLLGGYLLWTGSSWVSETPRALPSEASATPVGDPVVEPAPPEPRAVVEAPAPEPQTAPPPVPPQPEPRVRTASAEPRPATVRPRRSRTPATPGVVLPPPEVVAKVEPRARILIRSRDLPGDIYIDDKKWGETRDPEPIEVPPGSYDVVVKSQYVQPVKLRVEVEPGELFETTVVLEPVPGEIRFREEDYADHCVVVLNDKPVGPIGELPDRALVVEVPNRPHAVTVECDGQATTKRYPYVPPRTSFPAP